MDEYLKIQHYGSYRHQLELVGPKVVRTDSDQKCLQQLYFAMNNPIVYRWTSKLLDSSGSFLSPGLMSGTYISFGDFEACLSVSGNFIDNHNKVNKVMGKHCFITVRLPSNASRHIDYRVHSNQNNRSWINTLADQWIEFDVRFPIAHSICLPSVCQGDFIRDIILEAFKPLNSLSINVDYCQTKENANQQTIVWSRSLIIACIVLSIVTLFAICGTFVDLYYDSTKRTNQQILLASFSLITNVRQLFNIERSSKYQWIDGIRSFLTMLVLFSHVSINHSVQQLSHLPPFAHYPDDYVRQSGTHLNRIIVNSTVAVKSYFMLSGFLLAANFGHKRLHSFVRHLLTRWLRFTPSLIGYVSITIGLASFGYGPLFHSKLIEPYVRPCIDHLWMQLLYINNWYDFHYSCGFQTWYISADFQLYLFAYPVLFLISRKKWFLSYFFSTLMIIISYLISLAIFVSGIHGIPFFISVVYPQLPIAFRGYLLYWTATYNHLEAYFLGIIIGIVVSKQIKIKLSESFIRFSWNGAFVLLLLLPETFPWFLKSEHDQNLLDLINSQSWFDAIMITTNHATWLLLFAWIFYLASIYSSTLESNYALRFLCSPVFAPLARLCFCVYLVHVPLTWFNVHSSRYPQMRDEFGVSQFTILTSVNSLMAAAFLHLLFEAPFNKFFNHLFAFYDRKLKNASEKKLAFNEIKVLTNSQI
ncbi:hypothetical protein RDWZM_003322 [Blomia tropicalis]|uniref:Nose resistant-to-fluoxetine protein N-terminal domain-containing protein n=1 Tax=Blomia tropicalis TaxID=40697 RepID=A0A9Q0MHU8_BLOTA|nr:hypothetical protein RDWZM_003322 [Blomia tropicalis]